MNVLIFYSELESVASQIQQQSRQRRLQTSVERTRSRSRGLQQQGPRQQSRPRPREEERRLNPQTENTTSAVSSTESKIPVVNLNNLKHTIDNFKAGAIANCLEKWEKITCDPWILKLIEGYEIEFLDEPYQTFRPQPLRMERNTALKLEKALEECLG